MTGVHKLAEGVRDTLFMVNNSVLLILMWSWSGLPLQIKITMNVFHPCPKNFLNAYLRRVFLQLSPIHC